MQVTDLFLLKRLKKLKGQGVMALRLEVPTNYRATKLTGTRSNDNDMADIDMAYNAQNILTQKTEIIDSLPANQSGLEPLAGIKFQ